jgi:hypothetical protein
VLQLQSSRCQLPGRNGWYVLMCDLSVILRTEVSVADTARARAHTHTHTHTHIHTHTHTHTHTHIHTHTHTRTHSLFTYPRTTHALTGSGIAEGNLMFNLNRETSNTTAFNSWNRRNYITSDPADPAVGVRSSFLPVTHDEMVPIL